MLWVSFPQRFGSRKRIDENRCTPMHTVTQAVKDLVARRVLEIPDTVSLLNLATGSEVEDSQ